jgi:predicted GNAT superfamily acetyltransferase
MSDIILRPATIDDVEDIVTLNATSVAVTSPMDNKRFRQLFDLCAIIIVADIDGQVAGFLIGLTDDCAYDNGNYRWFAERLKRFVYIDRVVVSEACRSSGVGRALYSHIQSWAKNADMHSIAAEMDVDPPNTVSLNFHQKAGFVQVGTRTLESGKVVSMQIRCL